MKNKQGFEIKTCSRCGGSGEYSYNQRTGRVCFRCHGQGVTFSTRGGNAKQFFEDSLKRPVSEIKIGGMIKTRIKRRVRWMRVDNITNGDKRITNGKEEELVTIWHDGGTISYSNDSKAIYIDNGDEWEEKLKKALEYQEKLGVNGKLLKKYINA